MRRRGLKPRIPAVPAGIFRVASRAEAWIETNSIRKRDTKGRVASRAEAWIETLLFSGIAAKILSPPVRRRGLKRVYV